MDRYYIKGNGGWVKDKTGIWVKYSDHKVALNEAIKAENEACAMTCENRLYQTWQECAGAIRERRENNNV